jgi:hypothetical protein
LLLLLQLAAFDGDEARAEALQAAHVLVAAALVDGRLRPNSVSSGSTLRQLLCTLQSPQPSQTSSLMTTRLAGSTAVPRLRRRRFSVAQVWS